MGNLKLGSFKHSVFTKESFYKESCGCVINKLPLLRPKGTMESHTRKPPLSGAGHIVKNRATNRKPQGVLGRNTLLSLCFLPDIFCQGTY